MTHWDQYFVDLLGPIAAKSKDRSRKVGCIIVGPDREIRTTGYNGMPRGAEDDKPERHERPMKYRYFEHAERNAIYNAARVGTPLLNCTAYVSLFPCMDCARGIVQAGIVEVVAPAPDMTDPVWAEDFERAMILFSETGVKVRYT